MVSRMRALLAAASLIASLLATGCCGGYAVVRTTAHSRAGVSTGGELERAETSVLRYSRVGEPPNACGSGAQYQESLWIQLPSLRPGQAYSIGSPGVVAVYEREQAGEKSRARSVIGKVSIKDQRADRVVARLDVSITLQSGEVVKLDDDYDFHTAGGRGDHRSGAGSVSAGTDAISPTRCL